MMTGCYLNFVSGITCITDLMNLHRIHSTNYVIYLLEFTSNSKLVISKVNSINQPVEVYGSRKGEGRGREKGKEEMSYFSVKSVQLVSVSQYDYFQ